jgi:hypothetical protein
MLQLYRFRFVPRAAQDRDNSMGVDVDCRGNTMAAAHFAAYLYAARIMGMPATLHTWQIVNE